MRVVGSAIFVIALAPAARADTVTTFAATIDGRAYGGSWSHAAYANVTSVLGGARVTMSFEAPPLPVAPPTLYIHDTRLVPELFAGFLADDTHAEGMVGAGLRAELRMSSHRHDAVVRGGAYIAARAILIGGHQDGAAEFVIGSYITTNRRGTRVGWEGGAMMRPRHDTSADQANELDALITMYVGR